MRHIVSNPYHLWAHQSQEWAANSGRTCSFRGVYAYSYRAAIGKYVTNSDGARVYLLSNDRWSVTTSKHQNQLARAVPSGYPVFHVLHLDASHEAQIANYLEDIEELAAKSKRARKNKVWIQEACLRRVAELRAYCAHFACVHPDLPLDDFEELQKSFESARAEQERIRREKLIKDRAEAQEKIERWQGGEPIQCPYFDGEQFLRIKDESTVQTSLNAEVPLEHVRRILPLVLEFVTAGKSYTPEHEVRLGHYRLNSISSGGTVTVGCHKFRRAEVERFAELLTASELPNGTARGIRHG